MLSAVSVCQSTIHSIRVGDPHVTIIDDALNFTVQPFPSPALPCPPPDIRHGSLWTSNIQPWPLGATSEGHH